MKRTARLVRMALEGRAIHSAADVAAAVARSGTGLGSRHEGTAAAAGPGGAVISSRDPSLTAGALGGEPGRRVVHAAGGPNGGILSHDLSHATAGGPGGDISSSGAATGGPAGTMTPRGLARAAGGPDAISSRVIPHAAGGIFAPRELVHATGGVIPSRELSHPAGGVVTSRELAYGAGAVISTPDIATVGGPVGLTSSSDAPTGGPPGTMSPRGLARAAGGPGAISSRLIPHGAGGIMAPRVVDHATGGVIPSRELSYPAGDVIKSHELAHGAGAVISTRDIAHGAGGITTSRDLAQAAGGLGGASGHKLDHAVLPSGRCSGQEGNVAVVKKKKKRRQEEREATQNLQQGLARERVGSTMVSLLTQGTNPTESASSSKVRPLAVQDKVFVSCQKRMEERASLLAGSSGSEDEWVTDLDVSETITFFLTQLPGPIASFCMDCSKWTDSTYLVKWFGLLSQKSVQEIDVLNLGHSVYSRFPIESLESKDLQHLRIGFFTVDLDLLCFNYTALQTLEFFSCSLDGKKLSWVVTDCLALEVLKVYYCHVDLHIKSNTLQVLDCIGNIGNRMVIASAPKLLFIACGIMPKQLNSDIGRHKILASIYFSDVPSLKCMNGLSLPHNKILVNTKDIAKDVVYLTSVIHLSISLEMFNSMQVQNLRKLLESFPMLQSLNVMRMDGVGSDEGLDKPFEDIGMVDCVKNSLTSFSFQGFRGGDCEMHLIRSVLKNAPNLISLSTARCESSLKKVVCNAVKEIKRCDIASEVCQFSFE